MNPAVLDDVTERKQALDQLHESERRYRLVVENSTDVIWTAENDGLSAIPSGLTHADAVKRVEQSYDGWRFTYMSPSVERILGYSPEEALRLGFRDLIAPASSTAVVEALAEQILLEQDPAADPNRRRLTEMELLTKQGGTRWCEASTRFLRDDQGKIVGVLGVTRDIAERKAAEAALRQSELTLRGLVSNMPDLVLVVDEQATIQFANRDVGGVRAADLIGRRGFGFLQSPHREAAERALRDAFEGREVVHVEVLDAFDFWWSCRLAPLLDGNRVARVMVICTDITIRKQAEESLTKEQELLRQMLDLSEHERELIAFEIHDGIAQELTGALLQFESAARLCQTSPAEAEPAFREGMRLLRASIEESRRLVSGLCPPVLDEFGILPAIEHLLAEHVREGGPDVELAAPDEFPRLARPLENALFRIVQESLTNARRHSRSDRVRVEISCDNHVVRLSVWDWGVGFDPAEVDHRHFGLRGIRERARLLDGRAAIRSTPGQGTRIIVEFPLVGRIEKATPPE